MRQLHFMYALLASAALLQAVPAFASDSQEILLRQPTQIPDAVLAPGNYTFSVEDHLQDRTIVRITSPKNGQHYLLLTVPNEKMASGSSASGLVLFPAEKNKVQAAKGWDGLEFAYPKLEAVSITQATGQPVLAVDPTSDKLPQNLSPDDMKVVTLWLLSPQHVTADHHGEGVSAQKYAVVERGDGNSRVAGSRADSDKQVASVRHLPKTASNNFLLAFLGLGALLGALCLRISRTRRIGV